MHLGLMSRSDIVVSLFRKGTHMSNGRSFTRNRKGSPEKSRRKNLQRQRAAQRAMFNVRAASEAAIDSMKVAFEGSLPAMIEELVQATGVTEVEAEDALRQAVGANVQDPIKDIEAHE